MRGVRLGIVKPGLYAMQVRAIIEAAVQVKAAGKEPVIEIMIPLVAVREEFDAMRREALAIIDEVFANNGQQIDYLIGTMIETAFGFSRDDIEGKFLPATWSGHPEGEPVRVDRPGRRGPVDRDRLQGGPCDPSGAQAGHLRRPVLGGVLPSHGGLDYVSCSLFRVPARRRHRRCLRRAKCQVQICGSRSARSRS
jgi:pyruvate, orthophosphate dikinase